MKLMRSSMTRRVGCRIVSGAGGSASSRSPSPLRRRWSRSQSLRRSGARQAACGTVVLNENSWVGSTANVYVVKNVLEKKLKCSVKVTNITEGQPSFQAMADSKIDVVLEDWDNTLVASNKKYLTSRSIVPFGNNGIAGIIGWYIPRYLLKQYPQFKTWKGLKGKESVFKTAESSPNAGTFLGGDPSYVQKDRALIKELGLNLKHVVSGAEPAQVARWTTAVQAAEAGDLLLVRPAVPERDLRPVPRPAPEAVQGLHRRREVEGQARMRVRVGYPALDKLVSSKFAKSGSPALKVIRNFKWTSADQNFVANLIAGKHMDKDKAAASCGWRRTRPGQRLAEVTEQRGGGVRAPAARSPRDERHPRSPFTSPRRRMRRSLSDQAYYRIRELIVTLELAAGLARQRARADGAPASSAAHPCARRFARSRASASSRSIPDAECSSRASTSVTSPASRRCGMTLEPRAARLAAERATDADRARIDDPARRSSSGCTTSPTSVRSSTSTSGSTGTSTSCAHNPFLEDDAQRVLRPHPADLVPRARPRRAPRGRDPASIGSCWLPSATATATRAEEAMRRHVAGFENAIRRVL